MSNPKFKLTSSRIHLRSVDFISVRDVNIANFNNFRDVSRML